MFECEKNKMMLMMMLLIMQGKNNTTLSKRKFMWTGKSQFYEVWNVENSHKYTYISLSFSVVQTTQFICFIHAVSRAECIHMFMRGNTHTSVTCEHWAENNFPSHFIENSAAFSLCVRMFCLRVRVDIYQCVMCILCYREKLTNTFTSSC